MTKIDKILGSIYLAIVVLGAFTVWAYQPDYSRRGKIMFIGKIPCMIISEDKAIFSNRDALILSQNLTGEFYQVKVPIEILQDIPTVTP